VHSFGFSMGNGTTRPSNQMPTVAARMLIDGTATSSSSSSMKPPPIRSEAYTDESG
jgi:hypothetical protein